VLAIARRPAREQISFCRIRQLDNFGEDLAIFDRIFPATTSVLAGTRPATIHMFAMPRRSAAGV